MAYKILVIDDDKINVTLVKFALAEQNYSVVFAHDGDEGLKAVRNEKPDLIILDIQMPKMNGYEFMGELKRLQGVKTTPVIMLTANETMEQLFQVEGVKAYFLKPVNLTGLIKRIKEILGPNPMGERV